MSLTFAAWRRHFPQGDLRVFADPAAVVRVALRSKNEAENDLIEALAEWQAATGPSRHGARAEAAHRGARYRAASRLYRDVWQAFCAERRDAKEAA